MAAPPEAIAALIRRTLLEGSAAGRRFGVGFDHIFMLVPILVNCVHLVQVGILCRKGGGRAHKDEENHPTAFGGKGSRDPLSPITRPPFPHRRPGITPQVVWTSFGKLVAHS